MGKFLPKCPVCNSSKYPVNTINGYSCCECCDGEFCFSCGSYPVDLLGNAGVCLECMKKRTMLDAFKCAYWIDQTAVFTEADAIVEIQKLRAKEASGVLDEDEACVVYELQLGGHYKGRQNDF